MIAASPLSRWALSPDIVHLNHGSFGGCLRATLTAASATRARIAEAPMQYFVLHWQDEVDRARAAIAQFLGADPEGLVPVAGATHGVAVALHAARAMLSAGDEIVTTSDTYRSCKNQLARLADAIGARIVSVPIATPFDPDALVADVAAALTSRTRLALFDHITSATALVLPLERLVDVCAARGVPVIVDGAHAPGQIDLDVGALLARGVGWYTGNHHKWLCAPLASGFLAIAPQFRTTLPLVTSHGASPSYGPSNRLWAEHDWAGTNDPSSLLAVPTALELVGAEHPGGWPAIRTRNRSLVLAMRDVLGAPALAPDDATGAMVTLAVTLPPNTSPLAVEKQLLAAGVELPVVDLPGGPRVRLAAHLYNHLDQVTHLPTVLAEHGVRIS